MTLAAPATAKASTTRTVTTFGESWARAQCLVGECPTVAASADPASGVMTSDLRIAGSVVDHSWATSSTSITWSGNAPISQASKVVFRFQIVRAEFVQPLTAGREPEWRIEARGRGFRGAERVCSFEEKTPFPPGTVTMNTSTQEVVTVIEDATLDVVASCPASQGTKGTYALQVIVGDSLASSASGPSDYRSSYDIDLQRIVIG